ncbi:MAG: nucleotidyl transferase AbiEii/AbiGii toxin family protein, partial [Nanoarchaeota archaeon]
NVAKSIPEITNIDNKETKNSILFKIRFEGILTISNTVRLDISLKNVVLNNFDIKNYASQYMDINPFSIRIMTLKEIISEKIHAIYFRHNARDLYDLFFLLKLEQPNRDLIDKKLNIFGISYNHDILEKNIILLKSLWKKELSAFILGELPEFEVVKDFVLQRTKI